MLSPNTKHSQRREIPSEAKDKHSQRSGDPERSEGQTPNTMLQFRPQDRPRVASGEITVTYRLWTRAHVKAGSSYHTGFGVADVEAVDLIAAGLVPATDIALTGCDSIEAIWASAGDHTKAHVTADTLLHRVQFRFRP